MVKKDEVIILLDMDGVIIDLIPALEYLYDTKFDFSDGSYHVYKKLGIQEWELSQDLNQSKFWEDLRPTPYMEQIFKILKDYNLYHKTIFCTQGIFMPDAHAGRLRWIMHHCPEFFMRKAFISIQDKSMLANPNRILIDDYQDNCYNFMKSGGWAIHFKADWNPNQRGNPTDALKQDLQNLLVLEDEDEKV